MTLRPQNYLTTTICQWSEDNFRSYFVVDLDELPLAE
jgi:hypothetical protein